MSTITQTADGAYSTAKFIVSKVLAEGTHQTITAALLDASATDTIFVKPGVYTENLSLVGNVNIASFSFSSTGSVPQVQIVGKATLTEVGDVVISGISLNASGDFFLETSGLASGIITLQNCFLDCIDHYGISMLATDSKLFLNNCKGEIRTTGISYATISGNAELNINNCRFRNVGRSVASIHTLFGNINVLNSSFTSPFEIGGIAHLSMNKSQVTTSTLDGVGGAESECIRTFTTSKVEVTDCWFDGGNKSAINVSAGCSMKMRGTNTVLSDNVNTISGLGTVRYSPCNFPNAGNKATISVVTRQVNKIGRDIIVSGTINAFVDEVHAFSMTEDGEFNYPLHPAFSAALTINVVGVTGTGTAYPIIFDLEIFDQGDDFDLATSVFTAPLSGKYRFNVRGSVENGTLMKEVNLKLITSNRDYVSNFIMNPGSSLDSYTCQINQLADMDAGDTARVEIYSDGEVGDTNTVSGNANNFTAFSGSLEV